MARLANWFFVPMAVLAAAALFALFGWLQNIWLFTSFSVVGLVVLMIWRRAAFRLQPSAYNMLRETREALDDRSQKLMFRWMILLVGVSITIYVLVLLGMIVFPAAAVFLLVVLFWVSLIKFAVLNILTNYAFVHGLLKKSSRPCTNLDSPQH